MIYDPRGMTWDKWCALTAEQFAAQQLGTVPEDQWRTWVDALAGNDIFMASGVPDSRGFGTWQEWAQQYIGISS